MINVRNFITRSISGAVLVALLMACILWTDASCFVILSLVALGCQVELLRTLRANGAHLLPWFAVAYAAVYYALLIGAFYGAEPRVVPVLFGALFPFVRGAVQLYRRDEHPLLPVAYESFALLYTAVPVTVLVSLASFPGYRILIAVLFILVWINDVGAYLVGVTFGRHKLFERLSPKKSWEGFFGGVVFTVAGAWLLGVYWVGASNGAVWGLLGLLTAVAGVLGDLFESMFKRSVGVKDSGRIIPGHGGFLDRFDAFLFAAPLYVILLYVFNQL